MGGASGKLANRVENGVVVLGLHRGTGPDVDSAARKLDGKLSTLESNARRNFAPMERRGARKAEAAAAGPPMTRSTSPKFSPSSASSSTSQPPLSGGSIARSADTLLFSNSGGLRRTRLVMLEGALSLKVGDRLLLKRLPCTKLRALPFRALCHRRWRSMEARRNLRRRCGAVVAGNVRLTCWRS
jgi:hypothetical protein